MAVTAFQVGETGIARPLRIAIVTETFPPEINGVALTLASLVRGLADLGHSVMVIRPRRHGEMPDPGGEVTVLPVSGAPLPAYPGLRFGFPALRRIRRAWRRDPPDIVYVATEGPLGWAAVRIGRGLGIPVISGYHTRFDDFARHYFLGFAGGWISRWLRHFHNTTRATIVPTWELRRSLEESGFRNVEVLRRSVDTRRFHPERRDPALRSAWGVDDATPAVLFVGRIAPEKNPEIVVRAFEAIRKECPLARMVWVGDGPARGALEADHPEFIFAGLRRGEDLARHYASGDIFLFGSLTETFGNVTLEALASGLAVVAYDCGAAREHITSGTDGLLAPPGADEQFIHCARYLARYPQKRNRIGLNARAAVSGMNPERVARDFAALLARHSLEESK